MTTGLKYRYDVDPADLNSAAARVIQFVGTHKRVLDVGAGPGSISRVLKERFGCDVTAVEVNSDAVDELETFCDRVHQVNLNDPGWTNSLAGEAPFQVIIAADVLEHLLDPLAALRSLAPLLAADGYIVVSLPNVAHNGVLASLLDDDFRYGDWGLLDRTHLRFFAPRNVDALIAAADLEIVSKQAVTRHPLQTEFADCWNRLAPEQHRSLSGRTGGTIYQLVIMARPRNSQRTPADAGAVRPAIGAAPLADPAPGAAFAQLMLAANDRQQSGDLDDARRLFLRAIAEYGESFDALHLLGTIELQQRNAEAALPYFRRALPLLKADFPPFFRNLGLCLAALWRQQNPPGITAGPVMRNARSIYRHGDRWPLPAEPPQVSVIIAAPHSDRVATKAVGSINEQRYPNIELILVDGGTDSAAHGSGARRFPTRHVRDGGNTPAALFNKGVAEARGRYIALLDARDSFSEWRIDHLVRAVSGAGTRWGFSNAAFVDDASSVITFGARPDVDAALRSHASLYGHLTISEGVMDRADLLGAANLFFERSLWREIGGFRNVRFHANWLFALSASILAEPVYIDEPDYIRTVASGEPIATEEAARATEEALLRERWLRHLESVQVVPNRSLEQAHRMRRKNDFTIMGNGGGHLLERGLLVKYLMELSAEAQVRPPL